MKEQSEIEQKLASLNKEAEENWQDERITHLESLRQTQDGYQLSFSVGKYDKTRHDIEADREGWKILCQSQDNDILDDIMTYIVMPTLFPSHGGKRKGSGRKPEDLTSLTIRVSPQFADKIKRGAKERGTSQGKYIESLLADND